MLRKQVRKNFRREVIQVSWRIVAVPKLAVVPCVPTLWIWHCDYEQSVWLQNAMQLIEVSFSLKICSNTCHIVIKSNSTLKSTVRSSPCLALSSFSSIANRTVFSDISIPYKSNFTCLAWRLSSAEKSPVAQPILRRGIAHRLEIERASRLMWLCSEA